MISLGERKLIFIKILCFYFLVFSIWRKFDMPNANFYVRAKAFYRKLHYLIQGRLSLLISKSVFHNFAGKLLAALICLWCTLTCLWTVISRSSLRRLFFVIVIDSALIPPWLVRKIKEYVIINNKWEWESC